jgi:hypothetical protein
LIDYVDQALEGGNVRIATLKRLQQIT